MGAQGPLPERTDRSSPDSLPLASTEPTAWRPFTWHELRTSRERHVVRVRIGSRRLSPRERAALNPGAIVSLDNSLDEPVEILVDDEVFGFGQLVVVGGRLAVQISEIRHTRRRRSA
jgi:flagellar motor switch protein FliN/FliY